MIQKYNPTLLRFEAFELDLRTGELRKNGHRIRLQDQPTKLLTLLASHPGDLVTRDEIQKALWVDGQFVEFEHAINTDIRKIRDALEDDPKTPRIIETLPKKGYRFIAKVEEVFGTDIPEPVNNEAEKTQTITDDHTTLDVTPPQRDPAPPAASKTEKDFALPQSPARVVFLIIQVAYLAMYCAALRYWGALDEALTAAGLTPVPVTQPLVIVIAMCGIAVRLYLLSSVGFAHPAAGLKFQQLFPVLLVLDAIWAASPLLAARTITFGVALMGVAGLAYLPFSQRTLMQSIYPRAFHQQ